MKVMGFFANGMDYLTKSYQAIADRAEFGSKAASIFENCSLSYYVSDIRGVEIIVMKQMASNVTILNQNPFGKFNRIRPVLFSKEFPFVSEQPVYKNFFGAATEINSTHNRLLSDVVESDESRAYQLNFSGAISFDALITFSGMNITTIFGPFPSSAIHDRAGDFIDTNSADFINGCVAAFVKEFYSRMESTFTSMDIYTDISLTTRYFMRLNEMRKKNPEKTCIFGAVNHPLGMIDLTAATKSMDILSMKQKMISNNEFINNGSNNPFEYFLGDHFKEHAIYTMYVSCSVQTLLYLMAYTDIVVYYTDLKSILGNDHAVEDLFLSDTLKEKEETKTIVSLVEKQKKDLLAEVSTYQKALDKYNDQKANPLDNINRPKTSKPKPLVDRLEYFNLTPLYAPVNVTLSFKMDDFDKVLNSPWATYDIHVLRANMQKFVNTIDALFR